jgi:hypothetical protein
MHIFKFLLVARILVLLASFLYKISISIYIYCELFNDYYIETSFSLSMTSILNQVILYYNNNNNNSYCYKKLFSIYKVLL